MKIVQTRIALCFALSMAMSAIAQERKLSEETLSDAYGDESVPETNVRSSVGDGLRLNVQVGSSELNSGVQPEDSAESPPSENDWRFDFHTWAWMVGVEGDIGARGLTADVSASFSDILEASDSVMAFSGRLEVGKGRWGGFIDAMYASIGVDGVSGPAGFADIDITQEVFLTDFGAMYRLGEWTPSGEAANNLRDTTLDLYAGGRYTYLDLELDPASLSSRSQSRDWLDPIIGAKVVHPFSEKWHMQANADIGGFGVESDFTWSTTAVAAVDFALFKHPATAYFGYRAIGWDFTEGSGSDQFTWDVVMHGPIVGFSLEF